MTSTTPSRLRSMLDANREAGQTSMGIFVTCGFPTIEDTVPILHAVAAGGADFIELGMPFSDPLAEGPTIQGTSARAIENGVKLETVLESAARFRASNASPLVLMGYYNPILQYGIDNFCRDARSSGVDGLILADLPPEEASDLREAAKGSELDVILLVAPNTSENRMTEIDRASTGFVYAVSIAGLTGSTMASLTDVTAFLYKARRRVTRNPLLVGFGIRTSTDAAVLTAHADGFIVGSALMNEIERLWSEDGPTNAPTTGDAALRLQERLAAVTRFVADLRVKRNTLIDE